jgi:hypothetical protein
MFCTVLTAGLVASADIIKSGHFDVAHLAGPTIAGAIGGLVSFLTLPHKTE